MAGIGAFIQVVVVIQLPRAISDDPSELRSSRLRGGVLDGDVPGGGGGSIWREVAHLRSREAG